MERLPESLRLAAMAIRWLTRRPRLNGHEIGAIILVSWDFFYKNPTHSEAGNGFAGFCIHHLLKKKNRNE